MRVVDLITKVGEETARGRRISRVLEVLGGGWSDRYCWRLKINTNVCVMLLGYPVTRLHP